VSERRRMLLHHCPSLNPEVETYEIGTLLWPNIRPSTRENDCPNEKLDSIRLKSEFIITNTPHNIYLSSLPPTAGAS